MSSLFNFGIEVHLTEMTDTVFFNKQDFDFILAPISHHESSLLSTDPFIKTKKGSKSIGEQVEREKIYRNDKFPQFFMPILSDRLLSTDGWNRSFVAKITPFESSEEHYLNPMQIKNLKQEIDWALYLCLKSILLPPPPNQHVLTEYACLIYSFLQIPSSTEFILSQPIQHTHPTNHEQIPNNSIIQIPNKLRIQTEPFISTWQYWHQFRTLCQYHPRFSLALDLNSKNPSQIEWDQWKSEPISIIRLHVEHFQSIPVSSSPHLNICNNDLQSIQISPSRSHSMLNDEKYWSNLPLIYASWIGKQTNVKLGIIFAQPVNITCHLSSSLPHSLSIHQLQKYRQSLIRHLQSWSNIPRPLYHEYHDWLQKPLQPLSDNLTMDTYQIFEYDKVKYEVYQMAIKQAIEDLIQIMTNAPSFRQVYNQKKYPNNPRIPKLIIMVLGAGRGPLVEATLDAYPHHQVHLDIYALDKNPHAIKTLLAKKRDLERWKYINVVHEDMRHWMPPFKAHLIISEVLGSFGDNELSPECLWEAQRLLQQPHGICIPQTYESFLAPISTPKIYQQLQTVTNPYQASQIHYVVNLNQYFQPVESKSCFKFHHPNWYTEIQRDKPLWCENKLNNDYNEGSERCTANGNMENTISSERYRQLTFDMPISCMIHGFAGYFECQLYKDIKLSIEPRSATPNMYSWFPMYFPLLQPVLIEANDEMKVHWWRRASNTQVWYEWTITNPITLPVHNINGTMCSMLLH